MQVIVNGQNMDIGEALKTHVEDHLTETCQKFFDHTIQATVHFQKEPHAHYRSDITVSVGNGIVLKAKATESDVYPAFDHALDRIAKQLRRYKGRIRDHHQKRATSEMSLGVPANQYVIEAEKDNEQVNESSEYNPLIIAENQMLIEELTVGEAVMRLDLADLPAMMFRNTKNGRVNMVYRRVDGNIGWLDPKEALDSKAEKQAAQ